MSWIACVHIPNLPIALARQDEPALAARPLVLYTIARGRAAVAAASDDAGVAVGTPLHRARVRSPQAVFLPANPARVTQATAALERRLGAFSPRVVVSSLALDVAFSLDLGRLALPQVLGAVERIAEAIHAELDLAIAIGVAANPLVAMHAARRAQAMRECAVSGTAKDAEGAKEDETTHPHLTSRPLRALRLHTPEVAHIHLASRPLRLNLAAGGFAVLVPPGAEAAFLASQPVATLELDAELLERLTRLGLRTVGDLARLPLDALQAQFGGAGLRLYQLARGVDAAAIPAGADAPTLSRTRRFAGPLLDRALLEHALATLAARLAADLAAGGWSAGAVALTLDVEDSAPIVLERALAEPTSQAMRLTPVVLALSRAAALESGVTTLTVSAQDLAPVVAAQLELFAPTGGSAQRLRDVLDRLGGRFSGSLLRAELAEPDAALPERRVSLEPR